jgi:hypothetical protein
MPRLPLIAPLVLCATLGCGDPAAPEPNGTWGGPEATLVLSSAGGTVEYACGSGTVDADWRTEPDGHWIATGEHFVGGGPLPAEGRPPHAATYTGRFLGSALTFTVSIPELDATLGPFTVRRGAPGASEICL